MTATPDDTRWGSVSESNAIDARAKLSACIEALDHGDLRFAAELCQSAASKLRTAAVFAYVDRYGRRGERDPVIDVKPTDRLAKSASEITDASVDAPALGPGLNPRKSKGESGAGS